MVNEASFREAAAQLFAVDPARVTPPVLELRGEIYTIGRSQSCHIVVQGPLVSRLHARIERHGPHYLIADAGSANGTFVNGRRILEPQRLNSDDLIGLGAPAQLLRFHDADQTEQAPGQLRYDERAMRFVLGEVPVPLTPSQLKLLRYLYLHAGDVCSRESCAQAIYGREYDPGADAAALDQMFNGLRRALREVDPACDLVVTIRGIGYTLRV